MELAHTTCTRDTPRCEFWTWERDAMRPDCCTAHLEELLFFTEDLLTRHAIFHWLDYGTLLGAARSHELIPWDWDGDFSCRDEEYEKILSLEPEICAAGYWLDTTKAPHILQIRYSRVNHLHVDLFLCQTENNTVKLVYGARGAEWDFPRRYLDHLTTVTLYGCTTIDIRNWKVDDNNGAGLNAFGTTLPGSGSAAGHLRFSNVAQWATLPVGALIVIYNNTDVNPLVPPDDPNDTGPNDSVYVLPANHALLQGCGTAPNPVSTSSYAGCAFGGGNWNYVSLRNVGDAGQTRFPDGRYFHGISYGSTANGMNNGGLDNLRISAIDHTGRVLFFNNGSPRTAANFTSATVAGNETPGAPNNAANALYIEQLQCLTMPSELLSFGLTIEGVTPMPLQKIKIMHQ